MTTTPQQTLAVLGAGSTMGQPMARNLARAGFDVRAWNRSREKAAALAGDGVALCDTPAQAVEGAAVIVTMLSDGAAVLAVAQDALPAATDGATWLQMSTIGIDATERCIELAERHRLGFVDAPVLGTKAPAEQGTLVVLSSGPDELREPLEPIYDAVGQRTMWLGEAGTATRLKLALNAWVLTLVEGTAETLALAEGLGLDPSLVLDAVAGGPLDLPYLQLKGKAMLERNFDPSFRLALAAKDAGLVEEAMAQAGLDLPLLNTIRERLDEAAVEHGDKDMAATFLSSVR
jgi:3-hydroxyisobutyrate dehydrogenase